MKKIFTMSLLLAVFCASGVLNAQTVTWTGAGDGYFWSNSENWDTGQVPDAGDDVVIPQNGPSSFVLIYTPSECKSLLIDNNGSSVSDVQLIIGDGNSLLVHGDLTIKGLLKKDVLPVPPYTSVDKEIKSKIIIGDELSPENPAYLKVLGNLTLDAPSGRDEMAAIEFKAQTRLEIGGNFKLENGTGKLTSAISNTIAFNGTGEQKIDAKGTTVFSNLVIDKASGIAKFNRDIPADAIKDTLYIKKGTLSDGGYIFNSPLYSQLVVDAGARFLLSRVRNGSSGVSVFPTFEGNRISDDAIIEFSGVASLGGDYQDVWLPENQNPILELSGTGTKTLTGNIRVPKLTVGSGVTFKSPNSDTLTILNQLLVNGTLELSNTSTLEFAGASQSVFVPEGSIPNLILSGSGTKTMTANIKAQNLIIGAGVALEANSDTLTIYKAVTNLGGAVTLGNDATLEYAGGNQDIIIPNGQSPNLVLSGTGTKTLTDSTNIQSLRVKGAVTLAGNDKTLVILKELNNDGGHFSYGSNTTLVYGGASQSVIVPLGVNGGSPNLTLLGSGTKTLAGNISVLNLITIAGAKLVSNSKTLTILKEFTNIGGAYDLDGNSTLVFAGSVEQNVFVPTGQSPNLTLSGSGVKILVGDVRIQDLDVAVGVTFEVGNGKKLAILDSLSNKGIFVLSENSTLEFGGGNQNVVIPKGIGGIGNSPNLTLSGTGNKMLTENISVNNLTINSGTQFSTQAFTINLKGNFVNGGTFNAVSSTLNVRGENSQITGISQLHNLTVESDANLLPIETLSLSGKLNVFGTADFSLSSLTFNGGGAFDVSGVSSVKNLELNKSGTITLTEPLSLSGVLTLANGTLVSNGNLTVDLNTGYVDTSSGGVVTGNVTFMKKVNHGKSSYLSTPVNTILGDFNGLNYYTFDESYLNNTARYPVQTASLPITPNGVGYVVNYGSNSPTIELSGIYDNSKIDQSVTLYSSKGTGSTQAGWNIIGNPYAHDLYWDNVMISDGPSPVYVGIYYYANNQYTSYIPGIPSGLGKIAPMQGFMVYLSNPSSENISYSLNLPRSAGLRSSSLLQRRAELTNVLKLQVSDGNQSDATYVRLSDDATTDFDGNLDAYKMKNAENVPSFYSYYKSILYSINSIPATFDVFSLPLALEPKTNGEYTLSISEEYFYDLGYEIVLEDKITNTFTTIGSTGMYKFHATTTDRKDRFTLHFNNPVITNISNQSQAKDLKVFVNSGDIVLSCKNLDQSATVSILDIKGSLIAKYERVDLGARKVTLPAPKQNGIYIINIISSEYIASEKVIINQ